MNGSKKGITPVVATVLLITISIAATASAYTFVTSAQKDVANNIEDNLRQQERRQKSNINIEYVYESTGGFVFMNVRNTGSITIPVNRSGRKLFSLYADGRPVSSDAGSNGKGWKYTDMAQAPASQVLLDQSEVLSINTTVRFPAPDSRKSFKLVGPYRTSDSHVCFNSGTASC
ncbi:MAG: hypothetical protein ABEJ07_03500 [Candidatus Nanohaloarchaea archaeon]